MGVEGMKGVGMMLEACGGYGNQIFCKGKNGKGYETDVWGRQSFGEAHFRASSGDAEVVCQGYGAQ